MALDGYLTLTGETQGLVEGSVTQAGREGKMAVYAFYHEVISPRDAASGLPIGKRQHAPLTIVKPIDKATPILFNILANNENITEFRLDFWKPSRSGKEFQFYTIELTNARISGIRSEMLNNKYPENMKHEVAERISFTYQQITEIWQDGGIVGQDDWETPVA